MAVVLGILTAILLIPVRVSAFAQTGQMSAVTLRYLFFSILLYPSPEQEKPEWEISEEKKTKQPKTNKPKREIAPLLSELLRLFERLSRPVQKLLRRTSLAKVTLRLVVVGEDAAATALRFGQYNAVAYAAVAILDRIVALRVKEISIIPGFTAEREEYTCSGELRLVPLAVLIAAIQLGFWALVALIKSAGASKDKREARRKVDFAERKEEVYGNETSH